MVFTLPPISLSFFLFLSTATDANAPPYTPTDHFLLNCGTSGNTISADGRNWVGDESSKFSPTLSNISGYGTYISRVSKQDPSVDLVPYITARFFRYPYTYTFPVSAGPKFLRLYFYWPPTPSDSYDPPNITFTVTASGYTLLQLSNFSPSLASLRKEFIVNVGDTKWLNITFLPTPANRRAFAFVNGIEIVSMPDNFYMRGRIATLVGPSSPYSIEDNATLEMMYRLNVGGTEVGVNNDTGMFRSWAQDGVYLSRRDISVTAHLDVPITYTAATPNYTAPVTVYTTSRSVGKDHNLTWSFPVDSGFYYLLRLHFCGIGVNLKGEPEFTLFIDKQLVPQEADVIAWSGGSGTPVFRDYVVYIPERGDSRSQQDLWLDMYPSTKAAYDHPILNGLEIFRLNHTIGRTELLVPTPPTHQNNPIHKDKNNNKKLPAVIGGVAGVTAIGTFLVLLIFQQRKREKKQYKSRLMMPSLLFDLCRRFSLAQMRSATGNFNSNLVIGKGGFGNVYKGLIDDGATAVAIKRLNASSNQGANEFETEIRMLSKLRHLHLVSLIGFCDDKEDMILVYDLMANGTLRDHLYNTDNPLLSWKQRLQICIGSAKGLHYLHTGTKSMIIHRDVKSTNILLDEKWVAKVSDFGLSKVRPNDVSQSHVSTVVKGSFGYLDPEYYRRQQLTEKSDVYSFGVVLFEVLCARPAVFLELPMEQVNLAEWVRHCKQNGTIYQMVDPHLRGQIAPKCLAKFLEVRIAACETGESIGQL